MVKIGTRGSALARIQAGMVGQALRQLLPQIQWELVPIKTRGDLVLDATLHEIGGRGLFVKEIEEGLVNKQIDMAVHSLKDMPSQSPQELVLACVLPREEPRDAWLAKGHVRFHDLAAGSIVGTSSLRRQAQILHSRPDLLVKPLRGNVNTRLRRLKEGDYHAIVLAAAGLIRLDLAEEITQLLPVAQSLPAVCQGIIAVQCRENDQQLLEILHKLNHPQTWQMAQTERAFLAAFGGGCQVPLGAYAQLINDQIQLEGLIAHPMGTQIHRSQINCSITQGIRAGEELAQRLLDQGGREILKELETKWPK